jgi:hypothetical protein
MPLEHAGGTAIKRRVAQPLDGGGVRAANPNSVATNNARTARRPLRVPLVGISGAAVTPVAGNVRERWSGQLCDVLLCRFAEPGREGFGEPGPCPVAYPGHVAVGPNQDSDGGNGGSDDG